MEIIAEIFIEIFMEGYVESILKLIPSDKISKPFYITIVTVCLIITLASTLAIIIGFVMIFSSDATYRIIGICMLLGAILILALQVFLAVLGHKKKK